MRGDIPLNMQGKRDYSALPKSRDHHATHSHDRKSKVYRDEIIGESVRVVASSNPSEIGLHGRVVDESRNMFVIETEKGERRIIKKNVVIDMKGKIIHGKTILGRPEDRIKR